MLFLEESDKPNKITIDKLIENIEKNKIDEYIEIVDLFLKIRNKNLNTYKRNGDDIRILDDEREQILILNEILERLNDIKKN
jgi:hypothetical protein